MSDLMDNQSRWDHYWVQLRDAARSAPAPQLEPSALQRIAADSLKALNEGKAIQPMSMIHLALSGTVDLRAPAPQDSTVVRTLLRKLRNSHGTTSARHLEAIHKEVDDFLAGTEAPEAVLPKDRCGVGVHFAVQDSPGMGHAGVRACQEPKPCPVHDKMTGSKAIEATVRPMPKREPKRAFGFGPQEDAEPKATSATVKALENVMATPQPRSCCGA